MWKYNKLKTNYWFSVRFKAHQELSESCSVPPKSGSLPCWFPAEWALILCVTLQQGTLGHTFRSTQELSFPKFYVLLQGKWSKPKQRGWLSIYHREQIYRVQWEKQELSTLWEEYLIRSTLQKHRALKGRRKFFSKPFLISWSCEKNCKNLE